MKRKLFWLFLLYSFPFCIKAMNCETEEIIASTAQKLSNLQDVGKYERNRESIFAFQEFFNACMNKDYKIESEVIRNKLYSLDLFDKNKQTIKNRKIISKNLTVLHAKIKTCTPNNQNRCVLS